MDKSLKQRLWLWILLAALVLAGALRVCSVHDFRQGLPIETNLLDLLPKTERNAVAETAVQHLSALIGNRVFLLIGAPIEQVEEGLTSGSDTQLMAASRAFAHQLQQSGVFQRVDIEVPAFDIRQIQQNYLAHRTTLLADDDAQALQQSQMDWQAQLQQKLMSPMSFGMTVPLAEDPFGLGDRWLAQTMVNPGKLTVNDGILTTQEHMANGKSRTWVLVSILLRGSSYDATIQEKTLAALQQAEQGLHQQLPGAGLLKAGAVFYASDAQASTRAEVDMIGLVSLTGILLLMLLVYRSVRPLLLGLASVAWGILTALVVILLVYGKIHLITLVFGASLIGEAFDYSIQFFSARMAAGVQWQARSGIRNITSALTMALLTSLLGYAALAGAPFPALSQIAMFAMVGLLVTWATVLLLLPIFLSRPHKITTPAYFVRLQQALPRFLHWLSAKKMLGALIILAVVMIPGWRMIEANDDIRILVHRSQVLQQQEQKVRQLVGLETETAFFLVQGNTPEQVLQHEEQLDSVLKQFVSRRQLSGYQSISTMVPSTRTQLENHQLLQSRLSGQQTQLAHIMSEAGLREEVIAEWLQAMTASAQPVTIEDWLQSPVSMPVRHLWLGQQGAGYASIVQLQRSQDMPALQQATSHLPGVVFVDKPSSVSQLLAQYRQWSAFWLAGAFALILVLLGIRYRWRRALLMLLPPLLAIFVTIGVLGYAGITFTLFNMMALMLVLGVGVNYAIFLYEGGWSQPSALVGVLLSAATTLLSFGLLSLSHMPALSGFGATLLIGIGVSVICAPLSLLGTVLPESQRV
ncbi:MAG: MMPL family transporter [Methylophilus sp.]|uniref:MMPL family transporter n=1 Tax=Methylophilus sp. TaxID=29541 RepID=UPI003FA187AC